MARKDSKGERETSTIKLPSDVWRRAETVARRHGSERPGVYVAELITAMHPNPARNRQLAASMHWVIPGLLQSGQVSDGDKKALSVRTPLGVKDRVKVAFKDYGYPDMISYLAALISALHPLEGEGLTTASTLVDGLLKGDLTRYFLADGGPVELSFFNDTARPLSAA